MNFLDYFVLALMGSGLGTIIYLVYEKYFKKKKVENDE